MILGMLIFLQGEWATMVGQICNVDQSEGEIFVCHFVEFDRVGTKQKAWGAIVCRSIDVPT